MKLVPLVETVRPDREAVPGAYESLRPKETEADLIAAAAMRGQIHANFMTAIKDEDCTGGCFLCQYDNKTVFASFQESWTSELELYGVEWDPEIRL